MTGLLEKHLSPNEREIKSIHSFRDSRNVRASGGENSFA